MWVCSSCLLPKVNKYMTICNKKIANVLVCRAFGNASLWSPPGRNDWPNVWNNWWPQPPTGIFIKQPQKCVGSKCSMNLYSQIWGKGHSYTHKRSTCVLDLVKHQEGSKSPSHGTRPLRGKRFGWTLPYNMYMLLCGNFVGNVKYTLYRPSL